MHHTERSKWRLTFRRMAGDALAALQADDPGPAQQAVAEIVDLACELKRYDYFHSDDPVEAAKFVVSDAVTVLWESVLRHDGFAAFARRVPEQLIRWEADYGWTRRGYGQVPEKETALAVPLARLLATPDMWRKFAESYLAALDAAGRADPKRPRSTHGSFDETRYLRQERTKDLAYETDLLEIAFDSVPGLSAMKAGEWRSLLYALLEGAPDCLDISRDDIDGTLYPKGRAEDLAGALRHGPRRRRRGAAHRAGVPAGA